jgi:putative ABC transport system substrate-binding protein
MRRRDFISLLGCTALWPVAAHAQPVERIRRIGVLLQATQNDLEFQSRLKTFLDGLAKFGWTEGRNLQLEYRWAGGNADEVRRHAAELVALAPDVTSLRGAIKKVSRALPPERGLPRWRVVVAAAPKGYSNFSAAGCNIVPPTIF